MKSPIKALIFDFDGLLFDSELAWDSAHLRFLKEHNLLQNDEVEAGMYGSGLIDVVKLMKDKMGLAGETSDLVANYRRLFYEEFFDKNDVLMPGAKAILEKAKRSQSDIALTSGGHTKQKLIEILKLHKIYDYFSVIVSSDEVSRGKPAPDVYLEALSELGQKADFCLAFEDSPNGVVAAKAAEIRVYGVNSDEKIRNDLVSAGADRVFKSLLEIEL